MKSYFLAFVLLINSSVLLAQPNKTTDVFAFRITDYMVNISDSTVLVQIQVPESGAGLVDKQTAVLKGNFSNTDTADLGSGRCNLIKGDYYYFGIFLSDKKKLPQKGDVLYTFVNFEPVYNGQIYKIIKNDIYLQHISEGAFYDFSFALTGNEKQENAILDSLIADVKYTADEMLSQGDGQDRVVTTGRFKNKKIFAAMKTITKNDMTDFLDYVIVFPQKYAGNDWKIAEVFATWMDGGAPTVIKTDAKN